MGGFGIGFKSNVFLFRETEARWIRAFWEACKSPGGLGWLQSMSGCSLSWTENISNNLERVQDDLGILRVATPVETVHRSLMFDNAMLLQSGYAMSASSIFQRG